MQRATRRAGRRTCARASAIRTWAPTAIDDLRGIIVATGALDEVEALIARRTEEAVAALDGADLAADARSALEELAIAATARSL